MRTCEVCGAKVGELRRRRCWACYNRWVESRPVGVGASCCICGERRRDQLRAVELFGGWNPACHSCSARIGKLDPMPQSIGAIRTKLLRERRFSDRRRDLEDSRMFRWDRRALSRRGDSDSGLDALDDALIAEMQELATAIARQTSDDPDLTCIREAPAAG